MTEATAYHLKQIMTQEHLSLTQTAKQIGISPSSMRKALKDTQMSRPIAFKIDRFIEEHPIQQQKNSFTIFDSAEQESAQTKAAHVTAQSDHAEAKNAAKAATQPQVTATHQPASTKPVAETDKPKRQRRQAKAANVKPAASATNADAADTKPAAKPGRRPRATEQATKENAAATKGAQRGRSQRSKDTQNQQAANGQETKAQNAKNQGNKNQSAKAQNAKSQNAKNQSAQDQSTKSQNTKNQSAKNQSTQNQDAKNQGAKNQSNQNQSAKNQSAAAENGKPKHQKDQPASETSENKPRGERTRRGRRAQVKPAANQQAPAQSTAQPKAAATAAKPTPQPTAQAASAAATQAKPEAQPKPEAQSATATNAVQAVAHQDIHPVRQETTVMIYMDESFGGGSDYQRNMSIGATVVDPDDTQALIPFMQTLYPFGWMPGDEVKARGKARDQLEAMLRNARTPGAQTYSVYSPLSDTGNFSLSFGILYPYVAALLRILNALPTKPTKVRVVMDQRSEITDEQLAMAARMLHAYVKAETGREVIFMFRTTDSKTTIGVQYSDFVSHAAMIFGPDQVASTGIHKLPNIGGQLGDQLQLFAMVGLQKYLIDDQPTRAEAPEPFKNPVLNAADRMAHLAAKAADMATVPDETFAQTKLVINQLLQITPASVSGAINKMPFQNWYDMIARTTAILHYTDESIPPFKIDPDAMQIVNDALANITTLLAGTR